MTVLVYPPGQTGPPGPTGPPGGGTTYIFHQDTPATVWTITHNLGNYPSVTVIDSGGSEVLGSPNYVSGNQVVLTFSAAFSGTAYLN